MWKLFSYLDSLRMQRQACIVVREWSLKLLVSTLLVTPCMRGSDSAQATPSVQVASASSGAGANSVYLLPATSQPSTAMQSVAQLNIAHELTLPTQVQNLRSRWSNYGTYGVSGSHIDVTTSDTYNYQAQEQGWFYYNWQFEQELTSAPVPSATTAVQLMNTTSSNMPIASSQQSAVVDVTRAEREAQTPTTRPVEEASTTLPAVPRNITSAWLRVNLPLYLEHAVDQPTDNNVLAFLYLQAFANQKAWVFSERAKLVAQGNDYLDNNGAFPNLYTARAYREQLAKHIRATLFNKFQEQLGLILLISSDYESRAFAQLVGLFSLKYNIKFVTANLHGKFQPDLANYDQITNLREVAQLVRKQQAQIYPTLYVVDRQQTVTLVTGAIDSDELEQRMLRFLFKQQYITQTEYNMARGILLDPHQSDVQLASLINGKLLRGQVRPVTTLPEPQMQPQGVAYPAFNSAPYPVTYGATSVAYPVTYPTPYPASNQNRGYVNDYGYGYEDGMVSRANPDPRVIPQANSAAIISSYLQGGFYVR